MTDGLLYSLFIIGAFLLCSFLLEVVDPVVRNLDFFLSESHSLHQVIMLFDFRLELSYSVDRFTVRLERNNDITYNCESAGY